MSSQSADLSAGLHPFSFSWDTTGYQGAYTLTVKLSNSSGSSVSSSVNVTVFFISQSADLWWFEGQSPAGYAVQVTVTANGLPPTGTSWSVTGGAAKVTLINSNANPVTVQSSSRSTQLNDVSIQLTYNGNVLSTYSLTVYAPACYVRSGSPDDKPAGPQWLPGFNTYYYFQMTDQFGSNIPSELPFNEVFGTFFDDCFNNWVHPDQMMGTTTNGGQFQDRYGYLAPLWVFPKTVWPTDPSANSHVLHTTQYYCAGSQTFGSGYIIKTHTTQINRGNGRQQ